MKVLAIILAILFAAGALVLGYLYFTSDIDVTWKRVADEHGNSGIPAADDPELFESVRASVAAGGGSLGDPSGYVFYTWQINVRNNTRIPMDTLEVSVINGRATGVVALIQKESARTLPPGSSCEMHFTVLSETSAMPELPIRVTWYLWGKMSEKLLSLK